MEKTSDNDLMIQVRDGRVEKMAILFERHHVMLYNFFLRLTGNTSISEDLVQEVFVRMLKYRSTYQGQDKFKLWIFRIARNAHIDFLRKKKDEVKTFGYKRAEVLAALFNIIILLIAVFYILQEAIKRFFEPSFISAPIMMIVTIIGLIGNAISVFLIFIQ